MADHYDILFIGHLGRGTVTPFEGEPFEERSSPVIFASLAASGAGKKVAVVTKAPANGNDLLGPLKSEGIGLFVSPGEPYQYRAIFPTANVDLRQVFRMKTGESIGIADVPSVEPCLVHLCLMGNQGRQLDLMRDLKGRGFRLSVDMQSLMYQEDPETGAIRISDVPEKREVMAMVDFVKLDIVEGEVLTGAGAPRDQADTIGSWGSPEILITSSKGVLGRAGGVTTFAGFTNRTTLGRMGRGDTVTGSYLARRLDYPADESLRFAAALTSIKLESHGPFRGSLEDVRERMKSNGQGTE